MTVAPQPDLFHLRADVLKQVFGYDLLETDEASNARGSDSVTATLLRGALQADLTLSLRDSGKSMWPS